MGINYVGIVCSKKVTVIVILVYLRVKYILSVLLVYPGFCGIALK